MRSLICAAAFATLLAGPAFAQAASGTGSSPRAGSGASTPGGNSGVSTGGGGSGVIGAAPPQPVGGTNAIGANTQGINSPAGAGGNSPR